MWILYRRFDINTMFCKKWLSRFFHVFKICIWHNEKMLHLWTSHLPILIGGKKLALYSILVQQKKETGFGNDWRWRKKPMSNGVMTVQHSLPTNSDLAFASSNLKFYILAFTWDKNFFLPAWHLLLPIWNFTFIQFSEDELFSGHETSI